MNNYGFFAVSHYVVPDTVAMRVAKDRLNMSVAGQGFNFLPSLKDKLAFVGSELNDAHQQLFDDIKKVHASLANTGFVATLTSIQEVRSLTDLSSVLKDEQTGRLLNQGVGRVSGSQVVVASANRDLARVVRELESISFAESTGSLRSAFGTEVAATERRIETDRGDLEKLAAEKRFIDDAIQRFKAPGWRSIVNSLLPSAEEIEAAMKLVATQKPDKEFLQMVLNKLQGNLEGVDQGRQFTNLAQARDAVRERTTMLDASLKSDESQVRELRRKLHALDELDALGPVIRSWSEEVAKVAEAYTHFLQANKPESIADVSALEATAERYEVFQSYLKAIKKS
ncbi:alpha-xenorhabdolysin family binary toxin subunit B [Pseudomonas sp. Irchel s3h17]|uniref:alpha-xenorhabdolysin family binary toxin subunit B n=1 Tax=Pseudomonas sp. Irchel s3h17 TaxID=2009182 RepID=UPI00117A3757|nr:alpha-xenorhabdolysin family binary toxin subunit B [Pseudomonas sp. Irchel s3h17]